MRKFLPILFSGFILQAIAQQPQLANCLHPTSSADLDIGNVRAKILTGGDMWWDLVGSAQYEIPKSSGKHSLFAGALWIGGYDDFGFLRVAAQTYRQSGDDFWTGPLDLATTDLTPAMCSQYDRIWKLTRTEVQDFVSGSNATQAIIDYPGNGNANQAQFLAPFVDINSDGIYNYLDGDYPMFDDVTNQSGCNCTSLHGDQVLWWVINDVGNVHSSSGSLTAIGLEIHCQAFAYATGDADLNNATFYEYKIINRNTTTDLENTFLGFFVDVDLGNYLDDFVGCDVGRGLGYGYNGDMNDEGISGYGTNPPAVGLDIIHGPTADVGDGIDNDRDSCIDCTYLRDTNGVIIDTIPDTVSPELIKMSRFVYYNNSSHPVNGNPVSPEDYYGYLSGYWRNGLPITYGGNGMGGGIGATTDQCYFMYPGNSDPYNWGTNGVAENIWDEVTAGNAPDDRRFLMSTGPFTFHPGEVQCVQTAVLWARDSLGPQSSVTKLKLIDDKIGGGTLDCANFPDGISALDIIKASVYPIPANDKLYFSFNKNIASGIIRVYNIQGKLVCAQKFTGNHANISCEEFISGIYFYQVLAENKAVSSGKFLRK